MRTTEMRTSVTPLSMVRDPEDLLIETDFGVHLLPSSNELENVETRLKDERFADVKLTERRRPAHSKRIRLRDN